MKLIGIIMNRFWVSPASFLFPHSSTITNIQSVRYDKLLMIVNKYCLATQLSEITSCPVRFSDCIDIDIIESAVWLIDRVG